MNHVNKNNAYSLRFDQNTTIERSDFTAYFYEQSSNSIFLIGSTTDTIEEAKSIQLIHFQVDEKFTSISITDTYQEVLFSNGISLNGLYYDGLSFWTIEIHQTVLEDKITDIDINLINFNTSGIISNQTIETLFFSEIEKSYEGFFQGIFNIDLLRVEDNQVLYVYNLYFQDSTGDLVDFSTKLIYYSLETSEISRSFSNLAPAYQAIHYSKNLDSINVLYQGSYSDAQNRINENRADMLIELPRPEVDEKIETFEPASSNDLTSRLGAINYIDIQPQRLTETFVSYAVFVPPKFVGFDIYPIEQTPHDIRLGLLGLTLTVITIFGKKSRKQNISPNTDVDGKIEYYDSQK